MEDTPFGIGQLFRALGMLLGGWIGWRVGSGSAIGAASFWGSGVQWLSGMIGAVMGAAMGVVFGALLFKLVRKALEGRKG
jgi:hypothetical protein